MTKDIRFNRRVKESIKSETAKKEKDEKIKGDDLQNNIILADHIVAGAITTEKIQNNSINADKLQDNSINNNKIQANSITSNKTAFSKLDISGKTALSATGNNTITSMNPVWSFFKPHGNKLYLDEQFEIGNNGISVYNNLGGTAVTHTRRNSAFIDPTAAQPPNSSGYVIEIRHAPTESSGTSPGYGGWYFATSTSSGKRMVCVFKMKIPAGRVINFHTNSIGTSGDSGWLTSNVGTGLYEDYAYYVNSGTSTYSSTFFFAVSEGNNSTFYSYLASATVYELTNHESISSSKFYADDWFRSTGNTGWYNETHAGGIWMADSDYVRVYNNKAFMPSSGDGTNGIIFPPNPGGIGTGDSASIKYFSIPGTEVTILEIKVENDGGGPDVDYIRLSSPGAFVQVGFANNVTLRGNDITSVRVEASNGGYASDWPGGWTGGLATFDITCSGIYYSLLQQRSDKRHKNNINSISNGLKLILNLNPVTYKWNNNIRESDNTEHFGFIAQEVENIIPSLVSTDTNGYKSLITTELIPILVNAVQEQQKTIESLETRLKALEDLLK